jgi:hypothetical protein
MLVRAEMDGMGNITVSPVSERWQRKFSRHMAKWIADYRDNAEAFFQEGMGASEFMEDMTASQRKDLEAGWSVTYRLDPWIFGHYLGWDAHTVAECGRR